MVDNLFSAYRSSALLTVRIEGGETGDRILSQLG